MSPQHPIRLRPLASGDRQGLHSLIGRCSAESLYERFLTRAQTAGPQHVDALYADPDSYTAVVERLRPGGGHELVGFGSLFFADTHDAEIALLIADAYHGHGIGTRLAGHLCEYATAHGIQRLELTALARNRHIAGLFQRSARSVEFDHPDAATVTATVRLAGRSTYALAAA
jgi:RimJ/RimL family protein N-acetyltransferase